MCLCSGAVSLQISCFSEAERLYMLARDTCVDNKPLSSLVVPQVEVSGTPSSCQPALREKCILFFHPLLKPVYFLFLKPHFLCSDCVTFYNGVLGRRCPSCVSVVFQHQRLGQDVCPLLVFVNPKSGGLKGRELLYSFRKLLNPHQVFDLCNGGPLAG